MTIASYMDVSRPDLTWLAKPLHSGQEDQHMSDLKSDSNLQDDTPWQGDYRELKEEDFAPSPKPLDPPIMKKLDTQGLSSAILWMSLITITTIGNWWAGNSEVWSASYNTIVEQGEFWRLWTSLFIHSDFAHLMSNIWLFGVFAYLLRSFWGTSVFPNTSIVLIGGLTSLATVYWYGKGTSVIGASGMIYGMIGLWIVTYCRYDTRFSFPMRVFRASGFVLIMLFPQTYAIHVSYSAHFFGFIFGLLLGFFLVYRREIIIRDH